MMRSRSSKEPPRRSAPRAPAARRPPLANAHRPSPRGRAKNRLEVREAQHAAARELVGARPRSRPARARAGRLGDQRAQLVVPAAGRANLHDPAVLEQRRGDPSKPSSASAEAGRGQRLRWRSGAAPGASWNTTRSRGSAGGSSLSTLTHTGRPAPSASSASGREPGEHVAVAHDLVPDHRAEPVDHRQAHGRDVRRARRGGGALRSRSIPHRPMPSRRGAQRVSTVRTAAVGVHGGARRPPSPRACSARAGRRRR